MTTPAIRLIALDVDGTLLRPDRTISPRVADAIARASERVPVVLASARPPRGLRSFHEQLGLTTAQVNYNGALTWNRVRGEPVAHVPIDPATCVGLVEAARQMTPHIVLAVELLDRWYTDRVDARYTTETGKMFRPDHVGAFATFAHLGATKLMFHAEPAEVLHVRAQLEPRFAKRIAFNQTDSDLLQMTNRDTSKWIALRTLAASMGVEPAHILAVGDHENDIEMIGAAGVGVAMGNGVAAAIDAARWIAPTNLDDGVAVAIERFVL